MRFPDFYIAGHQKCGTTALYLTLAERDEVFLPQVKEPKFFATELRSVLHREGEVNPLHTEEGYLALYADARPGQLRGDASPQYLRSQAAPRLIAERRPDAKLVAIFREPADFLRSFHQQMLASRVEDQTDLRRALALEDERRAGRSIPRGCHLPMSLYYSDHVRYADQLARLRENFPPQNIHVIVYDDLRADPQATLRGVLEFLGLPPGGELTMRRTKPLQQARSSGLHRFAGEIRRAKRRPGAASSGHAQRQRQCSARFSRDAGAIAGRCGHAHRPGVSDRPTVLGRVNAAFGAAASPRSLLAAPPSPTSRAWTRPPLRGPPSTYRADTTELNAPEV